MKLQTTVEIPKAKLGINYSDKIMLLGSCFTENIGIKLLNNKFQVDVNPFGVLYNPLSIASGLKDLLSVREFTIDDLFHHQGQFHSFSHHSKFSGYYKEICINEINRQLKYSSSWLYETNRLFITFGSAFVYYHKDTGNVVSNCHRLPDKEFVRRRVSVSEIVDIWQVLIQSLISKRPKLKIIFTVSPIRHWKDGAHENQLSKATLHLAIDQLIHTNPCCSYFDAYEIVMDELRDYRFYAEDMIHPSDQAVEYIWEKFVDSQLANETQITLIEWRKLNLALLHKPLHPKSETYRQFLEQNLQKLVEFTKKYPYFVVSTEMSQLREQLKSFETI